MKARELLRLLRQMGGTKYEAAAVNPILKHPSKAGLIIVAVHGLSDVPSGTLKAILKQAGLQEEK